MIDLTDDERKEVLGEVLSDELQAILEYVKDMPTVRHDLNSLKETVDQIDNRLVVVEAVVKSQSADIKVIKKQLTPL